MRQLKVKIFLLIVFFLVLLPRSVYATTPVETFGIVNPMDFPNNKVGIHILEVSQLERAEELVNSSGGDWGYVTIVIRSDDRNIAKWQKFMKRAEELHLIPIVRIATIPEGDRWTKPTKNDAKEWAIFLNRLSWSVKNRYVVVYNEPNHAQEWQGDINPAEYAQILKDTRNELKNMSPDFFVLNAGFDASAPTQGTYSLSEEGYLREMEKAEPGIFKLLDGWSSHSYPNPEFSGSPDDDSKISIRGYKYELSFLENNFGVKNLPVFITETGWKHLVDGERYGYLSNERVGSYYEAAFQNAWSDNKIVAVTPFVLGYFQEPFTHFSFLKLDGSEYPIFSTIAKIAKTSGSPPKNSLDDASFVLFDIPNVLFTGKQHQIIVHVRNTGNTTWNLWNGYGILGKEEKDGGDFVLKQQMNAEEEVVQPGETKGFKFNIIAPREAKTYRINWQMTRGDKSFGKSDYSDVFVQAAVIIFNKEYLYHVVDNAAILEPTEEQVSVYTPRVLPDSIFYETKSAKEGLQSFLSRDKKGKNIFEISLLENRLAEVVALQGKGKTDMARESVRSLAEETEKVISEIVAEPDVSNIHAAKIMLVKQQIVISRIFAKVKPFERDPSFRFALLSSQKSLKKIVDTEKKLKVTAYRYPKDEISFKFSSLV